MTDITAKQRYPWNGLVDIACNVSGIEADAGGYEFAVVAVDKDTGKEYTVSNFSVKHSGEDVTGLDVYENGDYSLLWNAREDMGQAVVERMTVRITLEVLAASVGKVQLWEGGPYWADRNIGAKKPEDSGLYFWWGDTTGHCSGYYFWIEIYTWGKDKKELQSADWVTSSDALSLAHDAAHVKWGSSWRIPTYQELYDLCTKCDLTQISMNGMIGYVVHGKGAYSSNSIFLPCAGYCDGLGFYAFGLGGYYWSSTPHSNYSGKSYYLHFGSGLHNMYDTFRNYGFSIRPVQGPTE